MKEKFESIVGQGNISDNETDLLAYSYCSSDSVMKPSLIIWPKDIDEIRKIFVIANQSHMQITLRGGGTSLSDGCIGENNIILSSEKMNKIININSAGKTVIVESGVRIADLNDALKQYGLIFPITPFNPVMTIGGMISIDVQTKESHGIGSMHDWVLEVEFIDGTGKYFPVKSKEAILGREGIAGFIASAKLKVCEPPILSVDVFEQKELHDLLQQARMLRKDGEVFFMEFFDKETAIELGIGKENTIVAAYSSLKGKTKKMDEVNTIIDKIDSVHALLRSNGYYYIQDPFVSLEKTYDLIQWCENHKVRLSGHIGQGVLYAYFLKKDKSLIADFRTFIQSINGWIGKAFGFGLSNTEYVIPIKRKEYIKLKEDYDYNNVLNPGKVIKFR